MGWVQSHGRTHGPLDYSLDIWNLGTCCRTQESNVWANAFAGSLLLTVPKYMLQSWGLSIPGKRGGCRGKFEMTPACEELLLQ